MTGAELNDSKSSLPLSVIIPTRNEERNLRQTLTSVVNWADQIFVFDSFSDDRTLEIAREFEVGVVQRHFDNFAAHKNWALDNLPISNHWIFFLDADERLTPELRDEIGKVIVSGASANGYYVARRNIFMDRWIRHAGMYPDWQLRLFRRGKGRYEERIVHEHVVIDGPTGYLTNPLEHNDFKGLERWFDRHNHYTSMEAMEIRRVLDGDRSQRIASTLMSRGPERTRLIKEFAYRYLPGRAFFVFIWMYLIRGGFLDGRIGFRYCMLKTFVDYQTSLKLIELQSESCELPQKIVAAAPAEDASIVSGARSPQHNS
jgi:glycosyltransferase involved in cell wall biosynthesis